MTARLAAVIAALAVGCGSGNASKDPKDSMTVHPEYDFLLTKRSPDNRRDEFGLGHRPGPQDAAKARAAIKEDSRPAVRRAALRLLSAAAGEHAIADYVAALDDPSDEVVAEAAHQLAENGPAYVDRNESEAAIAGIRAHAARLRSIVAAPGDASDAFNPRAHVAEALVFATDRGALAVLLADRDLVGLGLDLASKLQLEPAEVKLVEAAARRDPKNAGAVRVLVEKAPAVGAPLLVAAIERGDVDIEFPQLVVEHKLTEAVPAMIGYLARTPRDISIGRWLDALVKLHATCAARAIAGVVADPAVGRQASSALRELAGHSEWKDAELMAWAKTQPDDLAPCAKR